MISLQKAKAIISNAIPECTVKKIVPYKGKWVVLAPTSDPLEGDMDPFYYVDMKNGTYGEFSVVEPGNLKVLGLF